MDPVAYAADAYLVQGFRQFAVVTLGGIGIADKFTRF
jgi:hypothetical protein